MNFQSTFNTVASYFILLFSLILVPIHGYSQIMGESLDFPSVNSDAYVKLSGTNDFGASSNWDQEFTFEAWVLAEDSDTWSRVFDFGSGEQNHIFFTTKSSTGECLFEFKDGTTKMRLYGGIFPSTWTHVAVTLDASGLASIYFNGNLINSTTWTLDITDLNPPTLNYLGKSQFSVHPEFSGRLDDVRVWKTARAQSQIQDWKDCELSGFDDNLIAYFKMNQGLSASTNTDDDFVTNYGLLSRQSATLNGFPLAGSDGNWLNDTPLSFPLSDQNCMELDGDGFELSSESLFDFTDAYTFEAWLYPLEASGFSIIMIKADDGLTEYPMYMDYTGTNINFGQRSNSIGFHNWATAFNALQIGKWQHVAGVTYEENGGVKNEIYVNGVLKGEKFNPNQALTQNNENVTIGYGPIVNPFRGRMSNIRFWDKRLTQNEIVDNMSRVSYIEAIQFDNITFFEVVDGLVAQHNKFENESLGLVGSSLTFGSSNYENSPSFTFDPCFVKFTEEPSDQSVAIGSGGSAIFTADHATCSGATYTYQWTVNGNPMPGATSKQLIVTNPTQSDIGDYVLEVTACGNQTFRTIPAELIISNEGTRLSFDGDDDVMEIPTTFNHNQYTIETWVYFEDDPADQNIILLTNEEGSENFFTHRIYTDSDGRVKHSTYNNNINDRRNVVVTSDEKLEPWKWYHIRATAGSMLSIAINGAVSADVKSISALAPGTKFVIGGPGCGKQAFKGHLDELRIWNIQTDTYNDPELVTGDPNLIHYFNFTKGVANLDNTALTPDIEDPFAAPTVTATLSNFNFIGNMSNWTSCGPFDANPFSPGLGNVVRNIGESYSIVPGSPPGNFTGSTYQWYKDLVPIDGLTSASIDLFNLQPSDAGRYSLRITVPDGCTFTVTEFNLVIRGSGEVLNFDGIDDYVNLETSAINEYSIVMWVKFEETVANQNLMQGTNELGPYSTVTNQIFTNEDGYLCSYVSEDGQETGTFNQSTTQFVVDQWYHIGVVMNNNLGEAYFYVDGVEEFFPGTFAQFSLWQGITQYFIGSGGITYAPQKTKLNFFRGEIDDLRIYDRVLTQQEILDTKDLELYSFEYFLCGCGGDEPIHNLQFNNGIANGNNADPLTDKIPDFTGPGQFNLKTATLHNFDLEGPVSNWSDCSPITIPEVFLSLDNSFPIAGQNLTFQLSFPPQTESPTDTNLLSYIWLKDSIIIPGETFSTLTIEDFTQADSGLYQVIVSDQCSPQFVDTLSLAAPGLSCFNPTDVVDIDYPTQTTYYGCTDINNPACITPTILMSGYCNSEIDYPGEEVVYKLSLTEPKVVTVTLSEFDNDIDLFLLNGCNIDDCAGASQESDLTPERIDASLPIGDHYIVVDTRNTFGGASTFRLDIELFDSKCYAAIPLDCGSSQSDNTADGTAFMTSFCGEAGYDGNEQIYEVVIDTASTLIANLSNASADLDLFLLDSLCENTICITSSTREEGIDEEIIQGLQPGTYYLVVDGKNGVTGTFDLSLECRRYFEVSFDDNDAFIDLNWAIDKSLCVPQDTGVIVRILTTPNTILYEEEFNTAALTPDIISGNYKHYVGPDHTRQYVLRVYNRLSNAILCNELKTGRTTPFATPEIVSISNAEFPDSIKLVWRNLSQLSDEFRLYREGDLLQNFTDGYTEDSLILSFVDVHNIDDSSTIQPASMYEYCIETYSAELDATYAQVCTTGSTYDIGFQASDLAYTDQIELTWNNVSAFCDVIHISRNGILLKTLSPSQTFYFDESPIYGIPTEYSLSFINNGVKTLEVKDFGSVAPNGSIIGRVLTDEGDYPIQGANLILSKDTIIGGATSSVVIANTTSDFKGEYIFEDVVYGLSQEFSIQVNKTGSVFDPAARTTVLDEVNPQISNINFRDILPVTVTEVNTLVQSISTTVKAVEDYLTVDWVYNYTPADTLFFNLYRDGNLILSTTDVGGAVNTFDDFAGVPDSTYTYVLQVTNDTPSGKQEQLISAVETYPSVTPLSGFDVTLGDESSEGQVYDPLVVLNWDSYTHLSENFDGFRVFRDGVSIGTVDKNDSEFSHIAPPGSTGLYHIVAYRLVNNIEYRSTPYPQPAMSITANSLFPPQLEGLTGRNIGLDIKVHPDGFTPVGDFYVQARYNGIYVERKETGQPNSTYMILGEFRKSYIENITTDTGNPAFRDVFGIPNENYTYRLSTYLELDGEIYTTHSNEDARICPVIEGPSNLAALNEEGQVTLTWDSNEAGTIQTIGLGYINYEGYELYREPDNGEPQELIADLQATQEDYIDYLNNPVYNIFSNTYNDVEYTYSLRAYFEINGIRYYADELLVVGMPLSETVTEPLPVNFTASQNLPNHVKLCWEWTAAKQSEFLIYRDTVLIATLPTTARSYYDYDAPVGEDIPYTIKSIFAGNTSQALKAQGRIPVFKTLSGTVSNFYTKAGLADVNIRYENNSYTYTKNGEQVTVPSGTFTGSASTSAAGYYQFGDIPNIQGMALRVTANRINVDFEQNESLFATSDLKSIDIDSSMSLVVNFVEYSNEELDEGIAQVTTVEGSSNAFDMKVAIRWSINNNNYDGFQVYRGDNLIAEVMSGEPLVLEDSLAFPGIIYPYGVVAFKDMTSGRTFSELVSTNVVFPGVFPVENLTATPFAEKNLMKVAWSHPLDNVDTYAVSRNGILQTTIPGGNPMMWYDSTGMPGTTYQYEVTAIKNGFVSDPIVVYSRYKGVGEVGNLISTVDNSIFACPGTTTSANRVELYWQYIEEAADGFEIYRDGEIIAEVFEGTLLFGNKPLQTGDLLYVDGRGIYYDYSGIPGIQHEYHVLAYVNRGGIKFTSGVEELFLTTSKVFPSIAQVSDLVIGQNNLLGTIQIEFEYESQVVMGFEILRDGVPIDTLPSTLTTDYLYNDFSGVAGTMYEYAVRAFDIRSGQTYYNDPGCEVDIEYPTVPIPKNFAASKGTFENSIKLTWESTIQASVDSFILENITLGTSIVFGPGSRTYVEVVNEPEIPEYEYRIRALKVSGGSIIYSDWSPTDIGWALRQITGNESDVSDIDCEGTLNGYAVDIDGDWAVSTIRTGEPAILIFKRVNGGWSQFQKIDSPIGGDETGFGHSVAIDGDHIIVGAPLSGTVLIYEYNGTLWTNPQAFISPDAGSRFGHAVDISGDKCIVSAPLKDVASHQGEIRIYELTNGAWSQVFVRNTPNTRRYGYGVAIDNNVAVVSYYDIGLFQNGINIIRKQGSNWAHFNYPQNYTQDFGGLFNDNIDLNDGKLVIGDRRFNNWAGRIAVIDVDENGNATNLNNFIDPGLPSGSDFGISVSVRRIPSPDVDATYILVGTSYFDAPFTDAGKVYLLTDRTGSWTTIGEFQSTTLASNDLFGWSVGLSDDAIIIGSIADGSVATGNVEIQNLLAAPNGVNATDGISAELDPSRVTITWNFDGDQDLLSGFNIYRDDEFLIFRSKATTTTLPDGSLSGLWDDNTGNAGQPYVYSVKSAGVNIPFESYGNSDTGFNTADGSIQGTVVTAGNGIPIPNVLIKAIGVVQGDVYKYETTTFSNGQYIIPDVYYDSSPDVATEYTVTASFQNNNIVPIGSGIAVLNSLLDPTVGTVDFVDNTAYTIFGTFSRPFNNCAIEGIKVTPVINGIPDLTSATTTDAEGNYSIVINPNDPNLVELAVRIDNFIVEEMDTLFFGFKPDADTLFTDFSAFPITTEINYVDTLTYSVDLSVKNTCDDPISITKWNIRIRTVDGCFDQVYQTNSNGNVTVDLLPLNYTMSVVGADVQSTTNALALDYFTNFPATLNLKDLHRDSLGTLSVEQISDMAARRFIYHVAPDIEITGFTEYLCTTETAILQQSEPYTISFDITEQFGSKVCSVSEGKIRISNPAAANLTNVVLQYDKETETFPQYTFTAGDPNQVAPFFYSIVIDYLSDDDIFLGRVTQLAFVEGSVALPGAGIIVDASNGNDAVPLPIMVLRDPPGDGSSAYIEGGQSITYESEFTKSFGGGTEVSINTELELFGANTEFGFTNTLSGSDEQVNTYTSTLTLSQTISTSDDESFIGEEADIVVGQGIVMSYGIINTYEAADCDTIRITQQYSISPDAAATTFHYTIGQIKEIIKGFQNDSIKIYNGDLVLTERGEELDRTRSLLKISSYIDNWRSVLGFHGKETLPFYNICTSRPPINFEAEPGDDPIGNIELWKSIVCAELGTGLNGTFVLDENIVWDDNLQDIYNAASVAIRNIARGTNENNLWNYAGNIPGTLALANSQGEFSAYGKPVENITAGGGVTIERSIQNVNASSRSNTSNFYVGNEISAAAGIDNEVEIIVGGFAGVGVGVFTGLFSGVVQTSSVIKTSAGIKGTFEYSSSNSGTKALENEVTTGYTLSDDDPEDSYSVTVIQGISQSQTPYFQFFGGFTSCPAEEGAIQIDKPALGIAIDGGTTDNLLLQNVDPNGAALIQLVADNLTPIASAPTRDLTISLDQGSNTNGAIVTLNGVSLNNGNLELSLDAFDPTTLTLTVERGPLFYEYDNLKISIEPSCGGGPVESVYVSLRFTSPCSPVTLVQPDDGWLINDNVTKLEVAMQDYDPDNNVLNNAILEYRKLGTGDPWDIVNGLQLEKGNEIPADTLADYNAGLDASILNPKYFFIWTIPDTFSDGQYEIRVRMNCDFSNTFSNTVVGTLARQQIGLFGLPQPSDQVWTEGDEISFSFNLPLDCSVIQGQQGFIVDNISIIDENTGAQVPFSVSCFNNKLQFVVEEPMANYDGHFLTMMVDEIPSSTGNISAPHSWTFRVITQKVYWANGDTLRLRLYEDEMVTLSPSIINTDGIPIGNILSLGAEDLLMDAWLTTNPADGQLFDLSPAGRAVDINVDASAVGLGTYYETIIINGVESFGNSPLLPIKLEVLSRPPNWKVNPLDFSESMTIVANWKFDNQSLDEISTDTLDRISVWVEDEIRGVANIVNEDGFSYAFISVYGRPGDGADTPLEFRIWDADTGLEYDGRLPLNDVVNYSTDSQVGTVGTPIILDVNATSDLARYLPLNGNGSWTGFSLFTNTTNMSVSHKLRSLRFEQEGDIIITSDRYAQYNDSIGWYAVGENGLDSLTNNTGYMIYLQGPADTLRVSGAVAVAKNVNLKNGWNWLGFPFENSVNVNLAFDYPAANGLDRLKKDTPLPGGTSQLVNFNPPNSWQGNLPSMEPNNLYKLFVSNPNPTELEWVPNGSGSRQMNTSRFNLLADPDDHNTWTQPDFASDGVMAVVSQVNLNAQLIENVNDKIAIFEGDTIRGYGEISFDPVFDTYYVSMVVEKGMGVYDIRYYDSVNDTIMMATNQLSYSREGEGTFELPYIITFESDPCPNTLVLNAGAGIFDVNKTYSARQTIRITGNHSIPSGVQIILDTPEVVIEGLITPSPGSQITLTGNGCN